VFSTLYNVFSFIYTAVFQTPTFTAGVFLHGVDSDKSTFYLLRCKQYTDAIFVRKEGKIDRYTMGF
jgi:hypothetical protein